MITATLALFVHSCTGQVTFEIPAGPIDKVVARLGEECGIKLDVEKQLRSQNLLLRITDRPVDKVLTLVAQVSGGVWEDTGTGKVLRTDRAAERKAEEVRRKAFEAEIDKIVGDAKTYKTLTAKEAETVVKEVVERDQTQDGRSWQVYEKDAEKTPQRRFLKRVMSLVGTKTLGSLWNERRVVFSTSPTRVQRPLPPQVAEAYATLVAETKIQAEAIQSIAAGQEQRGFYSPLLQQPVVAERPAAILLVYSRSEMSPQQTFSVSTVQESGLDELANCTVDPSGLARSLEAPKPFITGLEGDVEFSDYSLQVMDSVAPFLGAQTDKTAQTLPWLRQEFGRLPDSAFTTSIVSDILLQGLRQKKLDAVVSIPDFAFMVGAQARRGGGPAKLQTTWDLLFGTGFLDTTLDDGTLTAKTGDKLPAFRTLPKEAIAKLCRAFAAKSDPRDALADYALACRDEQEAVYGLLIAQFAYQRLQGMSMNVNGSFRLLRIYGRLDASAKQAARKGGVKLLVASLNPAAREDLRVLTFEDYPSVTSAPQLDQETPRVSRSEVQEPTIRLPDGLPATGELFLTLKSKDSLFRTRSWNGTGRNTAVDPVDPANVAYDIAFQERSGSDGGVTKFANATMQVLELVTRFGANAVHTAQMKVMPDLESAELVTWDKLPEGQRKIIADALPNARKAYEGMQQGAPGRIKPGP